ncbi:MAG: ABC transporter permease [Clostridium sp.]|uniref:ABC transporter permease subunit n=1 Tax=Clostridium sp. TaxID=1506 RepID=UPI003058F1EC
MSKGNLGSKLKDYIFNNMVTILFIILCLGGLSISGQPLSLVLNELMARVARNSFIVLALIIPVIAGMGLNFAIVLGAMAAQIVIIGVTHFGIKGLWGFIVCVVVTTPIAIIFGYFTGKLLNKTKGQEMITSMILGFFANGLYQLLFLFLVGTLIPMKNPVLMINGGIGIKNTVDLNGGIKYALDNILNKSLYYVVYNAALVGVVVFATWIIYCLVRKKRDNLKTPIIRAVLCLVIFISCQITSVATLLDYVSVPIVTILVIVALCIFNKLIFKTKLGQDFRTVGQNPTVANASGINVNKTRIKAIIISTVLAAWGQLIFLQNIGTLNTYGSHEQVGMFAIAAILIGGATVSKATNKQAILGVILFHTMFIVSPTAGKNLFNNAQIGEYFRVFVAYGVICVSLVLYAWKEHVKGKEEIKL